MPIYEYKCDECDHELERLQKISDEPEKTCPKCDEDTLRKLVSAAAFKLKGTGWYETDFKDNKLKTEEKEANSKKAETKTSSDTTKDFSKNDKKKPKPAIGSSTSKVNNT